MSKDNGGPAFPTNGLRYDEPGMSLREYHASRAMQGLLASDLEYTMGPEVIAKLAYEQADAMLKARSA